jgi:hypothetical protein
MRQILVLLTVAALAAGAAQAAFGSVPVLLRTPGAEFLELEGGNGRAAVTRRGALLVTIGKGRLRIVDLRGGGRPSLSPPCQRRARRVSPRTVEIQGRDIGCRISSEDGAGPWQAIMRGRRINASGRVYGSLTLDGADRGPTGTYSIGGGRSLPWPREVDTYVLNRK